MKISAKGTYYGAMRFERAAGGILLSEYDYDLPATDWHYHENPYFMYVLQGDVSDLSKKKSTVLSPGSLILHNWQEPHWNRNESANTRGFHIEFDRKWFEKHKLNIDLWEGSEAIQDPAVHHVLAKIYAEFRNGDSFSAVSLELLVLELCEKLAPDSEQELKEPPEWIGRLKDMIHENCEALSLDELSSVLGVHPVHISRAMPKYLSTTLGSYIRQHRVKRSLSFLLDGNLNLTEVAYICGFSDQSHFTRTFKMYFNMTPKDYRRRVNA